MFLDPSQDDALPPPTRLEAAAAQLAAAGDYRHLITFVDRWAAVGTPSPQARILQARALMALCQMDRAWIRLKDLVEQREAPLDAILTAAELFVARGWPNRARELLASTAGDHPDDPRLTALWQRASEPPLEPDPSARALSEEADLSLLPLAEDLLRTGQTLSGRGVLERLRRHHPNHSRIVDLLWALDGDFDAGPASLSELTARYAPRPLAHPDLHEDENTESITKEEVRESWAELDDVATEPGVHADRFPSLFRGEDASVPRSDDVTEEVTHHTALADSDGSDADLDDTDADEGGDTRIVRVMRRDGPDPTESLHKGTHVVDGDFQFDQWRDKMGRSAMGPLTDDLEDEDDDLVVLTRRERPLEIFEPPQVDPEDPTVSQIGREVAHLLGDNRKKTKKKTSAEPTVVPTTPPPLPGTDADDPDDVVLDPSTTHDLPRLPEKPPSLAPTLMWVAVLLALILMGAVAVSVLALQILFA